MMTWNLPHTLTFLPTYRCTAACTGCSFNSNPSQMDRISQERLLEYVDQAAEISSIRVICFSGGEPFLLDEDLLELVAYCSQRGLITRIVTNGYWVTSLKAGHKRLESLVEAGLNEINFSTGDEHVQYVPVDRVVRGLALSVEYGLVLALMIEDHAERCVTRDTIFRLASQYPRLLKSLQNERIPILESPWIPPPKEQTSQTQGQHRLANTANLHQREPCKTVLTSIAISPTEKLWMCCGLTREEIPDLCAGDLREATIVELVERCRFDFLKMWLFVEGPERILAWAAGKDPSIEWENRYAHYCEACQVIYDDPRIQQIIETHYLEVYQSVLFRFALYLESHTPWVAEIT